jgi:hypothetical protein
MARRALLLLAIVVALTAPASASAESAVGITGTQRLYFFDTASPSTGRIVPVGGLTAGETIIGIDWRPATTQLFAVTVPTGVVANALVRTYAVDIDTGAATMVGSIAGGVVAGAGDGPFGADFNAVVDRLRMVGSNNANFRINPNNGSLAANDPNLSYVSPATGPVSAIAYDRNFASGGPNTPPDPSRHTTLYAIDTGADQLARIGGIDGAPSPNGGVVTAVGPLGVSVDDSSDPGMDIAPGGTAYASLRSSTVPGLYTVNLSTGAATLVGTFPFEVKELTILPPDNCPTVAGNGQPDTDGDGKGDACDDDIDGDGWTNAFEAAKGTDPAKADTDGDGVGDASDPCPTVAATGGCPPVPPPDKTAPTLTVGKLASKVKLMTFLKGVTVSFSANESSSYTVDLLGKAKGATLARAADIVLATKSVKLTSAAQKLKLKPSKKLVGRSKKFSVRVQITATDAAGNRKIVTKTIKISG